MRATHSVTAVFINIAALFVVNTAHSQSCAPVKYYRMTLAADKPLKCSSYGDTLIEYVVPDDVVGHAVARFVMSVENTSASHVYFWNSSVYVGEAIHRYGIGDDVCPGATARARQNIGYGRLTSANRKIAAKAFQGAQACTDGTLKAKAGSTLSVWIEDPAPECLESTIKYSSFYARNRPVESLSWWHWPYTMTTVASETMLIGENDTGLIVVTAAEGTPWVNPNSRCGSESATLAAQIVVDGIIRKTEVTSVPASLGMGHLVFGMYHAEALAEGRHEVELQLGRNFGGYNNTSTDPAHIVTSGGCCGDAAFALIKY